MKPGSQNSLKNKVIFITGVTSGLGEAMAKKFAKDGAKIIGTGRRIERLKKLQKQLGNKFIALELDVRDEKAIRKAVKDLPKAWQNIDVLINNAGLALGLTTADKAELSDWETMIDTNIKGLVTMTNILLPGMVKRNVGHIVNIGSIAGTYPYPGGNVYGATKAFVKQFTLNLKADLLGTNLRMTNIEPGMVETEFSVVRFNDKKKADDVYANMKPLNANDIADCVAFALTAPKHVNINRIEVMPVEQAFNPFAVSRKSNFS